MTQEEETSFLFAEVESVELSEPHWSSGDRRISGGDADFYEGDHGDKRAGGKASDPTIVRFLEQGGAPTVV
jgi:hypothetical protein